MLFPGYNYVSLFKYPYTISPNLLLEKKPPESCDEVWIGDITYIPLAGGQWVYLAVWMDLFSRRIIGWQLEEHMKEVLIIAAFRKGLMSRTGGKGLIVHSDRGGQYAGSAFRSIIRNKEILQSMSRADNPYDNAFMESCFSRLKVELLQDGVFETVEDARTEIFEYLEMYYNTIRLHRHWAIKVRHNTKASTNKELTLKRTNKRLCSCTEESFNERGIEPLSLKHKQSGSALPKESSLII